MLEPGRSEASPGPHFTSPLLAGILVVVVVPFIFRILVHYETFFTRAQGPVIVIAKEEI